VNAVRDLVVLIAGLFLVFVGDRYCTDCGMRTNQVTNAQFDVWATTRVLPCRCGGVLQTLTEIKTAAAAGASAATASTDTHPHLH
jgi:hypothetical protein